MLYLGKVGETFLREAVYEAAKHAVFNAVRQPSIAAGDSSMGLGTRRCAT